VLTILSGLDKPASYVVRWLVMINNSDLLRLASTAVGETSPNRPLSAKPRAASSEMQLFSLV
jgi:hypothetical protein